MHKEYEGFKFVRKYGAGVFFPKTPDFTHAAPDTEPFWLKPESIRRGWFGRDASCAVYTRIT